MEIPIRNETTHNTRRHEMNQGMPMGGGNLKAILATGSLMFLFYTIGWSIMGTICLIAFLVVGFNSLFPSIAFFLWFLIQCLHHLNDGILIGVLIFWIVLLILFECAARITIAEDKTVSPRNRC